MLEKSNYKKFQLGCENLASCFDRKKIALEVLEFIIRD